ncbi:UbiA family prenyltransferase [Kaistia terrae]|uniref:UbiA family prenyltransferase n=1 Tax=Kaistia terrae TaxID=537017 RepID=A0ABW0Q0F7_9HYPH|nr:UbiA family prenyltransferase [Kaistia terrae]MCX5578962.1 UbiA family prenyltransferase [Kaistia terrae]
MDSNSVPLVVDLDGTLIRSDIFLESLLGLLSQDPLKAIHAIGGLRHGRAELKGRLADSGIIEAERLPINTDVLEFLRAERESGRRIYLASASDRRDAQSVAEHLQLFDGVFGSEEGINLSGSAKSRRLCEAFGEGGFDYIGDAKIDEAVWRMARRVYIANARKKHLTDVRAWAPEAKSIGLREVHIMEYIRTLRPHQWLKNLLIFVPPLAAHDFISLFGVSMLAFLSFCLCASSVYILNDLLDLRNDRAHSRKRTRPFAAGKIPVMHGVLLIPLLLTSSFGLALFLHAEFIGVLSIYYVVTCAYSFFLKKKMLIDVIALACLYGCRIWAGAAATQLVLSPWLIAFAIFIFLCLALVKRCSELIDHIQGEKGEPRGRGYRLADLPALQSMAAASGYISILVLALYFNSPAVLILYSHPDRLWIICVILLFWISRTLLLTHRGEMHDDPVVFATLDRTSLIAALACLGTVIVSL